MSDRDRLWTEDERVARAEVVAKHCFRLIGEGGIRGLSVNLRYGVAGTVERRQQLAGAPVPERDAYALALTLRVALIDAARGGRATGAIVVALDTGLIEATLVSGERDGWEIPVIAPAQPVAAT